MRRPARRSRKIGLTQGGRVQDGRPAEKSSRRFSRDLKDYVAFLLATKAGGPPAVLRENPSGVFFHPCEADDHLAVLDRLPAALHKNLRSVILRRTPLRDLARGVEARVRFDRVTMNSFPRSLLMTWSRGAGPAARRH